MTETYFVEHYDSKYGKLRAWFESREEANVFYQSQKEAILILQETSGFDRILKIKATKSNIKKKYHHYLTWDDFKAGMYRDVEKAEQKDFIRKAASLLSNRKALYYAMRKAAFDWKVSSEENLTNISCNRRAWLGWAACCVQYKVPEYLTRQAWHTLSKTAQIEANEIADIVISEWEQDYLIKKSESCQK